MQVFRKRMTVAVALATFALFADAQMGGGMRRGRDGGSGSGAEREKAAPAQSAAEQLSDRLYELRMRLLITPAQEPAWETFYARWVDRARAAGIAEPPDFADAPGLQAVQRQVALERGRLALTEGLYAATQNLYDRLAPDQQRTADQLLPSLINTPAAARTAKAWTRDSPR
jgi:hypothetical protein